MHIRKFLFVFLFFSLSCGEKLPTICSVLFLGDKIQIHISENGNFCATINGRNFCGNGKIEVKNEAIETEDKSVRYTVRNSEGKEICSGKIHIPKNKMKFAVIGDTSYKTGYLPYLIEKILNFSPDIVFHVGDFQYDTHGDKWSKIIQYFSPIFSSAFFHLTAGNHEYESSKDVEILRKYFPYEGEFSFTWSGIKFVGINTFKKGNNYLIKEILNSDYPVILFIHKPFVSLSRGENLETMNEDIFKKIYDKVSFVFAGHDHVYGRTELIFPERKVIQITSGGGGAYIYGCATEKSRTFDIDGIKFQANLQKCIPDFNVVLCEIDGERKMSCEAVSITRGIIDRFSTEL